MNAASGIKKYYVGLAILMAIMLACLIYTVSQAGAAKADKKTNEAVQKISNKLETYVISKGVPDSLQTAGISDVPSTVKYTKLSDQKYKICFDYKQASSGFDAGWWSLLGGAFDQGTDTSQSEDRTYFDYSVQYKHKKGQNCQTITDTYGGYSSPIDYGSSSSSGASLNSQSTNQNYSQSYSSSVCSSDYDSYYQLQGEATVASVDAAARKINFQTQGQVVKDGSGKSQPAISSASYDDITYFCSASQTQTTASAVKAGQKVKFFANSTTNVTLDKVQL